MKKDEFTNLINQHWSYIAKFFSYPKNDQELDTLICKLDHLLDIVGNNEKHELMGLIDYISYLIETYETEHFSVKLESSGIAALKFLMESNKLSQNNLPEIGSQGVVSEILNGKRPLNLRQITELSKRFNVDPCTFINDENEYEVESLEPPPTHRPDATHNAKASKRSSK